VTGSALTGICHKAYKKGIIVFDNNTFFFLVLFAASVNKCFKNTGRDAVGQSQNFRMPLNAHHKLFVRVINCLDDAIICYCHAAQRLTQLFDCLMVQGVDTDLQQTLAEGVQRGVPDDIDLVYFPVTVLY